MSKGFAIILAALMALMQAAPATAESLRMATVSLAPYGYQDGGQVAGLAHDIGVAIVSEAGLEPEEVLVSPPDGVRDIIEGKTDVFIAMTTPELEEHCRNLGSVIGVEIVILGRHAQKLRALGDVRGSIIAAVKDTVLDERISRENGIMVYPTRDFGHSLKMLMARRVDFAVGPRLGLFHAALQLRLPRKALGRPLTLSTGSFFLFASKLVSAETAQRLEEARQRLSDDGTLQAIAENYYL